MPLGARLSRPDPAGNAVEPCEQAPGVVCLGALPRSGGLVAALAVLVGCSQSSDRPPRLDVTCEGGTDCPPPITFGSSSDAGAGDAATEATIQASFTVLTDDRFLTGAAYRGTLDLSSQPFDPIRLGVDLDAVNVTPILETSLVWVTLTPVSPNIASLATVQPIDTLNKRSLLGISTTTGTIPLFLVALNVVDEIYSNPFSPPFQRNLTMAQVVVFVGRDNGAPVAGVTLSSAGNPRVLYAGQNGWSETGPTQSTGIAILANVGGEPLSWRQVTVTARSSSGTESPATFPIQVNAVTLGRIVVNP